MIGEEGICEPRLLEGDLYFCGRLLGRRDVSDKAQCCPGGTYICDRCFDDVGAFMKAAYNARAREKEWEV